ncbi:hypothetical protein [Cellulophaga sp. Hel_I_12]|uniref:hypothetical protein n=1 Tax=Cellulophaga sp. Hel_I_12 TaxID=1249972 RepID=UPI0006472F28|nr:hypothetical protein [Cellulophaga sp. Hel_I_12]
MRNFKKIILGFIILEMINLFASFFYHGMQAVLPITQFNAPPLYYDMDTIYGVTRQKNTLSLLSYPWGNVEFKTNSKGFRDDEFKNEGVLVIGNSFVEGFGVSKENRFTEIIERDLNISINNAGTSGRWSAIQSVVLLKQLQKEDRNNFKKAVIVLTPGEVINIGVRAPKNDPNRSYPYKQGNQIKFFKAKNNSFQNSISFKEKVKRFSKFLLVSKIYTFFKYYGAAKVSQKVVKFETKELDWLLNNIKAENGNTPTDIIILNNLGRIKIKDIYNYKYTSKHINIHIVDYPDDLSNYFISNGHLNNKGNEELSRLLIPIFNIK